MFLREQFNGEFPSHTEILASLDYITQTALSNFSNINDVLSANSGEFTVLGIVYNIYNNTNFFIIDDTGVINVYVPDGLGDLKVGDIIFVSGKRGSFNGLAQLGSATIEFIFDNIELIKDTKEIDKAILNNNTEMQKYIGQFVKINELIIRNISTSGTQIKFELYDAINDTSIDLIYYINLPNSDAAKTYLETFQIGDVINIVDMTLGWYNKPELRYTNESEIVKTEPSALFVEKLLQSVIKVDSSTSKDLDLPISYVIGDIILELTWETSHPEIISTDGKVTLPNEATEVTLTAKINYNGEEIVIVYTVTVEKNAPKVVYSTGFENGNKGAYALSPAEIDGKTWQLDDALIGSDSSDRRVGNKAVRIRNGYIESKFAIEGLYQINFKYAKYSSDSNSTLKVEIKTNEGNWITIREIAVTSTTLADAVIIIDYNDAALVEAGITAESALYIRISNTVKDERVNIDELVIYAL